MGAESRKDSGWCASGFEAHLSDLAGTLRKLQISHREVKGGWEPLENQPGGESRCFRVETRNGPRAARINFAQISRDLAVPIVMQYYLGQFGLAPRIDGIMDGSELASLMASHAAIAEIRTPWPELPKSPPFSAMIMEAVEDGWNILQPERSRARPVGIAHWNTERILNQVERIQNAMTDLGIRVVDPQFLISKLGEVRIIDLDHCFVVDSLGRYWGYAGLYPVPHPSWVPLRDLQNRFLDRVRTALELL